MPSHNIPPDASRIAPFLTHEVSFHGRTTLVPPDSSGRVRKEKQPSPARSRPESNHSRRYNGSLQAGLTESAGRSTTVVLPQREQSRDRSTLIRSEEPLRLASYRNSVVPDDPPPAYESDCNPQFRVAQPLTSRGPPGGIQAPGPLCPSCSCSVHNQSFLPSESSPTSDIASTSNASDAGSETDIQIIDAQTSPTASIGNDPPLSPSSSSIAERVRNGLRRQKSAIGLLASPVVSISSSSRTRPDGRLTASSSVVDLGETHTPEEPLTRTRSLVVVSRDESEEDGTSQLEGTCGHHHQSQSHQRSSSHPFSLLRGGSSSSSSLLSRTSPAFLKSTNSLLSNSSRHKTSPSPLNAGARPRSFSPARNRTSPPSVRTVGTTGSGELSRKPFFPLIRSRTDKCKDADAGEAIDSWEVLPTDCESAPRPSPPVLVLRSGGSSSSTGGVHKAVSVTQQTSQPVPSAQTASPPATAPSPSVNEVPSTPTTSVHPLSQRDRKVPPPPPPPRKTKRPPPPPPLRIPPTPGPPPIVTVRSTRSLLPPPLPPRASKPTDSPATAAPRESVPDSGRERKLQETSSRPGGRPSSPHELALRIPLPQTPARLEPIVLPRTEAQPVPVPDVPLLRSNLSSESHAPSSLPSATPPGPSAPPPIHAPIMQAPMSSDHSSSKDSMRSPLSPSGRSNHYHGRPLPTPPQDLGNSAYAVLFSPLPQAQASDRFAFPLTSPSSAQHAQRPTSPRSPVLTDVLARSERDDTPHTSIGTIRPPSMLTPTQYRSEPTIPEGLLIDLRTSVLVENDLPIPPPISPPATTSGLAGDDLLLSWDTEPEGPQVRPNDEVQSARVRSPATVSSLETPSSLRSSTQSAPPRSSPPLAHDLTDLDILLSRVNDESAASGSDYDTLLVISQFLGPASPTSVEQSRQGTPRIPEPPAQPRSAPPMVNRNSSSSTAPKVKTHLVKEQRRRVMKDGRVKLKLMLEGINVDKCGICFTQFKKGDEASMGSPACQHPFHGKCLGNWYRNSRTCPHCRQPSS